MNFSEQIYPDSPVTNGAVSEHQRQHFGPNDRGDQLIKSLAPLLDKYRGTIPLPFLMAWIKTESDGKLSSVTRLDERGYFQLHPGESKHLQVDHQRLSTDSEYSIESGIKLVKSYMQRADEAAAKLKFSLGGDLYWHIVKMFHWLPSALKRVIIPHMQVRNFQPQTWADFKGYLQQHLNELEEAIRVRFNKTRLPNGWSPSFGIRNVEKVFSHISRFSNTQSPPTTSSGTSKSSTQHVMDILGSWKGLRFLTKIWGSKIGDALALAYKEGKQDENILTDLLFYARQGSKPYRKLGRNDPQAPQWIQMRNQEVRPWLQTQGGASSPPSTGNSGGSTYPTVFPLPILPDGRKPRITSGHWKENPSRGPRPATPTKEGYRGHQGADIMYPYLENTDPPRSELKSKGRITGNFWAPEDVWVLAYAGGLVRNVANRENGWRLSIRHPDGRETTYRHLTQPIVKTGEQVQAGQRLAQLDKRGSPAHLHFEMREKGRYGYEQSVNPRRYLEAINFLTE